MDQQILETQTPDLTNNQPETPAPGGEEGEPAAPQQISSLDALKEKAKAGVAPAIQSEAEKAAATAAAVAAYKADFKFRAGQKEHEIPEFLRGVIKDEKSEKYLKDIFERAYGLPSLKERFHAQREEYQELKQFHSGVLSQIEEAKSAYSKGDLDTMFEIFRVSPEKVLQWAVKKVELSQMPPEQRQAYEAQRAAEKRAYELEKQQRLSGEQVSQQQSEYLSQMLDLVLERQDYAAAAQAYDSKRNKPGAFRDLVIRVGESEFALHGKAITPLEATKYALELIGEEVGATANPAARTPAPAPTANQNPAPNQAQPAEKKTLPNLAAGARAGTAPAKSKIKSLDDVRKKYTEIMGQ